MLELKNVSFSVGSADDELEIIDNISLTFDDGKFVVITGPNGGGKSTLAKLIMGIEQPTAGQIIYNGTDITHMSITERAKLGIGYAFQQPPRFKGLTVRRLLSLAHGSELPEDACCAYLTSVGLCSREYLNREVDASLSGGEVKRVEIATLMARNVDLAIFDEPEAGIDLWSFAMLVESFRSMCKNRYETVIVISHQERIMQLADEMIVVEKGKIRTRGTKEEILPQLLGDLVGDRGVRVDEVAVGIEDLLDGGKAGLVVDGVGRKLGHRETVERKYNNRAQKRKPGHRHIYKAVHKGRRGAYPSYHHRDRNKRQGI